VLSKVDISSEVAKEIGKAFQKNKPDIFIAGMVGSAFLTDVHGDIDVFVILGEEQESQEELASKHKEIIRIFREIRAELKSKNIVALVFTEFRMEEICRYLGRIDNNETLTLIHLKLYPTPSSIEFWQTNAVAKGYFKNVTRLFYGKDDAHEKLASFIERLSDPSERVRLEFLRSLSYETYEYLALSDLPSELLIYEGFNKLSYIVKYASIEMLNHRDYSLKSRMTWQDVCLNRHKLPNVMTQCIEFCTLHRDEERLHVSVEELLHFFELITSAIEKEASVYKRESFNAENR
jgi:hypothetical protein